MDYVGWRDLDAQQLDQVRAIYESSFPAWERAAFEDLLEELDSDAAHRGALVEQGSVLGVTSLTWLSSAEWWFLEYFAIRGGVRDQGLGTRLWHAMRAQLGETPLVLEIEHPAEQVSAEERAIREQRQRFYLRQGCVPLPVPDYRIPRLDGDGDEPMLLLATTALAASDGRLRTLVLALYSAGYDVPPTHPLALASLASLG